MAMHEAHGTMAQPALLTQAGDGDSMLIQLGMPRKDHGAECNACTVGAHCQCSMFAPMLVPVAECPCAAV